MNRSQRSKVAALLWSEMSKQGLSQSALAERAGVSQGTISALLNQKRSLSAQSRVRSNRTLRALASGLGLHPTYFERTNPAPKSFGQAVRDARLRAGLSLQQLGPLVQISYTTISLLERDKIPLEKIQSRWRVDLTRELGLHPAFSVSLDGHDEEPLKEVSDAG